MTAWELLQMLRRFNVILYSPDTRARDTRRLLNDETAHTEQSQQSLEVGRPSEDTEVSSEGVAGGSALGPGNMQWHRVVIE